MQPNARRPREKVREARGERREAEMRRMRDSWRAVIGSERCGDGWPEGVSGGGVVDDEIGESGACQRQNEWQAMAMAMQRSTEGDDSRANWPAPRSAALDVARAVKNKADGMRSGEGGPGSMAKAEGWDRGIWGNDLIRPARAESRLSERSGAGREVGGGTLQVGARETRGANEWTGQAVSGAEP
ncbi:hypothetical protein G7Z17_g9298 [Cylindrodendrum hubeiense]|uniref:Uncharacterized protein n=1 Tax=Cylindrodendrum hubeiense TaxID=595255 RepID=A0A9P5H4A5_9HYPO|nr:hypothetical protein G7Z17_g9298 [Cylindrodendrum hubeiense]